MQLQNGGGRGEGDEVLVAVHQLQRIARGEILKIVVEADFELLVGLVVLAQAHQVDAQLGTRAVELRVEFDGLAVILYAFFVAAVHDEEMADGLVAPGGVGIPRGFLLIGQPVDGGQNRLALVRIRVHREGLFGFLGGAGIVVVFERDAGQQFLSFHQLGIALQGFLGQVGGARVEILRAIRIAIPISAPA